MQSIEDVTSIIDRAKASDKDQWDRFYANNSGMLDHRTKEFEEHCKEKNFKKLTEKEVEKYISLIDEYVSSNKNMDYVTSDRLRKELTDEWQDELPFKFYKEMMETGRYWFHPFFDKRQKTSL